MITIKKIEILNYRSCIRTTIDTNEKLTALIGINGVGKSNILNSIQLLKKINRNRFFHKGFAISLSHAELNLTLNIDGVMFLLKSSIYYDTDENNYEEVYSAEIKVRKLSEKSKKWVELDADLYQFVEYVNRTKRLPFKDKRLDTLDGKLAVKIITYLTKISYYSATQFSDPTKCPVSIELEDLRTVRPVSKIKTHELFIHDLYRAWKSNATSFNRYIKVIDKNGIGLIDKIVFYERNVPNSSYKVKSGGKIQKIERMKNIIVPSIVIDGLKLSPNQLSEGTFKTLALIFYILNDESDLLLIEEPEVCVHHGLLSSIIELIKAQSLSKQIFISTHSDYVLDKLAPENVVLIKKTKVTGTIGMPLAKSLSSNEYKALKEYLKESGNLGEYWKLGGFENE